MEAQAKAEREHARTAAGSTAKVKQECTGQGQNLGPCSTQERRMMTVLRKVTAACGALDNLRLLAHFLTRSRSPCQGAACGTCDELPAGHISSSNVTSSWHLAYGVVRQKSNMDVPAGCHQDHRKVLRHLTCSTCCCCGSSADEVRGYMQGHRGRAHSKVTITNAGKCRGCGLFWNSSIMPNPSTSF